MQCFANSFAEKLGVVKAGDDHILFGVGKVVAEEGAVGHDMIGDIVIVEIGLVGFGVVGGVKVAGPEDEVCARVVVAQVRRP